KGKQLFSDDFDKPPATSWRLSKGKWELTDGAIKGSELKEDNHNAVMRHPMPFHNVVVEFSFRLDGAKSISFSVNDVKGHVCRAIRSTKGLSVGKDAPDKESKEPNEVLQTVAAKVKSGEWHAVRIEIVGKEVLASLDGKTVAFGSHDRLDVDKTN